MCKRLLLLICLGCLLAGRAFAGGADDLGSSRYLNIFHSITQGANAGVVSAWDVRLYVPGGEAVLAPAAQPELERPGAAEWILALPAATAATTPDASGQLLPVKSQPIVANAATWSPLARTLSNAMGDSKLPAAIEPDSKLVTGNGNEDLPLIPLMAAAAVGMTGVVWIGVLIKRPQLLKIAAKEAKAAKRAKRSRAADPNRLDIREFF